MLTLIKANIVRSAVVATFNPKAFSKTSNGFSNFFFIFLSLVSSVFVLFFSSTELYFGFGNSSIVY